MWRSGISFFVSLLWVSNIDRTLNGQVKSKGRMYFGENRKKSLEEIDLEIIDKLDMCYIEIINGDVSEAMAKFNRYLNHLLNSPKVKKRIPEKLKIFDKTKFYFEVWWV